MSTRVATAATPRHVSRTVGPRPVRRLVWTVLVLIGFVVAAAVGSRLVSSGPGSTPVADRPTESPQTAADSGRWWDVLAQIDQRRDLAWRQGRPGRLVQVFDSGAAALRADQAALRGYLRRGYDVGPTQVEYWHVQVVDRRPGRVRLAVVDRLRSVQVTDPTGHRRQLPDDRPTRHLIALRHTDSGWRIASIQDR